MQVEHERRTLSLTHLDRVVYRRPASPRPASSTAACARPARADRAGAGRLRRNDRHRSIVCVWSLRGRPRPTVSAPVTWDEAEAAREPDELVFGPADALARLERDGDLFAPVLGEVQALPGQAGRRGSGGVLPRY